MGKMKKQSNEIETTLIDTAHRLARLVSDSFIISTILYPICSFILECYFLVILLPFHNLWPVLFTRTEE